LLAHNQQLIGRQVSYGWTGYTTRLDAGSENAINNSGNSEDLAFSTSSNPFAGGGAFDGSNNENFASFRDNEVFDTWDAQGGGGANNTSQESSQTSGRGRSAGKQDAPKKVRSRSQDHRRKSRKDNNKPKDETPEEAIERLAAEDEEADALAQAIKDGDKQKRLRRQVKRNASAPSGETPSSTASKERSRLHSRGGGSRRQNSGPGKRADDSDSSGAE